MSAASVEGLREALQALSDGWPAEPSMLDAAFACVLAGEATPAQTGALLMGLERVGVTAEVAASGARAMRAAMVRVPFDGACVDVCGTGGDGSHSLNVSTGVSFVLAGCGLTVAKHGNRAMSSRAGAADTLEALGVNLAASPETEARALREAGIAFLFAQSHHPAMRHVAPVRRELGFRTVFNLLGPLSNPAGASRQIVGVYAPGVMATMAGALQLLGTETGLVLHGHGGLDEGALSGPTDVIGFDANGLRHGQVTPADAGLDMAPADALAGGDAAFNAGALSRLLDGERGAFRDAVMFNAALALHAFERLALPDAAARAAEAIDAGRAKAALQGLVRISGERA